MTQSSMMLGVRFDEAVKITRTSPVGEKKRVGHSIDHQPRFGHHMGCRKASHANHAAHVGKKTEIFLLSDKLLAVQDPGADG